MNENVEKPLGDGGAEKMDTLLRRTIRLENEAARWKREETALRDMERRYLALAENPLFIFLTLSGGRVNYMNGRAEAFFGFALRERPRFLLTDYVSPGFCDGVEKLLEPGEDVPFWGRRLAFAVIAADGKEKWIDLAVTFAEYYGAPAILATGCEIPSPDESSGGNSDLFVPGFVSDESILFCALNEECVPLFMTEGFRNAAVCLWGHSPDEGQPLLDLLPEGDRRVPFHLAFEKARGGERAEIGHEAGNRYYSLVFSPVFSTEGRILGLSLVLSERTEQRRLERELRAEAEKFRRLFSMVSDMMVLSSLEKGEILQCNESFLSRTGFTEVETKGKTFGELELFSGPSWWPRLVSEIGENNSVRNFEIKLRTTSGESFFGLLAADLVETTEGKLLLVSIRDISDQKKSKSELARSEGTDAVLGIPNRRGFERILATETERAGRYRGSLSVILIDLDDFHAVNDSYGQDGGDRVLKEFCSAMKSRIRSTDFLARWGGDEFAVLTPLSGYLAQQMADKIRDMICHYKVLPDRYLSCSSGVCEYRREMTVEEFMKRAEFALREAKRAGGNKTILAPPAP